MGKVIVNNDQHIIFKAVGKIIIAPKQGVMAKYLSQYKVGEMVDIRYLPLEVPLILPNGTEVLTVRILKNYRIEVK